MHPRLPNSPLTEVVCQLRFDGRLELLAKWGTIQEDLRASFPLLQLPLVRSGESPLLQPMHLATADSAMSVMLALNSVALSTRRHTTYLEFREQFARVVAAFTRHVQIPTINRVGLRYLNLLPPRFSAAPSAGQLHPCLRLRASGWSALEQPLSEPAQFVAICHHEQVKIRVALVQLAEQPFGAQGVVQLDLDAFQDQPTPAKDLWDVVEATHAAIDDTFFSLVTPEYLKFLKGEPNE